VSSIHDPRRIVGEILRVGREPTFEDVRGLFVGGASVDLDSAAVDSWGGEVWP